MKTKILSCFIILFLGAVMPSCKKAETRPVDIVTSDLIWDVTDKNAVYAQQFLNNIYTYLPTGFTRIGGDFLDDAAGDAMPSLNNTSIQYYTSGIVSTINNPDPYWSNSYTGIREVNIFLSNIDQVPATAASIVTWKAEARFIRAFMYFELLKRYGGIPLVGDKVFTLNDNLQLPRNNFSDCVDYITSECDAVKTNLIAEPVAATSVGRITRGAAVALKCRLYLYAASPLFNGGGVEADPKLKALTGYTTADPTRWQKVVDAAEELKAYNYYALVSPSGSPTQAQYATSYASIFTNKSNTELILAKQAANDFGIETTNTPVGYTVNNVTSQGRTSPTQNFVDAFLMTNGLFITDPASGYAPASPYTSRDARLIASVFYNGQPWLNRTGGVQTYDGGLDKPNTGVTQTKTGYYLKKFMGDFSTSTAFSNQSHNFIIFRYAEVLLNEAEAYNELGSVELGVQQIILLRKRAGIAAGANLRYGIPVGISQVDMRTLIQNERRIELSFEEHRFWDLRRWKTATTVLNGQLYGMQITKDATTSALTYQVVQVGNTTFTNKLYHMPIPYDEVVKNSNMLQNEGW